MKTGRPILVMDVGGTRETSRHGGLPGLLIQDLKAGREM